MQTDARLPTDPASVSYEIKGQEEEKFMSFTVLFFIIPQLFKSSVTSAIIRSHKLGSKGT